VTAGGTYHRPVAGTVMVVEDDASIGSIVRTYLAAEGFGVVWVRSAEQALEELPRHDVALIVLDISLPGMDGYALCRRLGETLPIIMLTARDEEADRVAGLEAGADDYVVKPFSPRELTARVKAVLRRAGKTAGRPDLRLVLGPAELWPSRREARLEGAELELTQKEFDLLAHLIERAPHVVTRGELLEQVWGFASPGETRTIDLHVAQLRRKLAPHDLIRTVRGVGYQAAR
jgi:DNA-binding response OmpR family regulator